MSEVAEDVKLSARAKRAGFIPMACAAAVAWLAFIYGAVTLAVEWRRTEDLFVQSAVPLWALGVMATGALILALVLSSAGASKRG